MAIQEQPLIISQLCPYMKYLSHTNVHGLATPQHTSTIMELQNTTLISMTQHQLQHYCTKLGLQSTGRNSILVTRLQQAISASTTVTASLATPRSSTTNTTTMQTTAGASVSLSSATIIQPTTALPPLLSNLGQPGTSV